MALVGFVLLIIVLLIVALIAGGSSSKSSKTSAGARVKHRPTHARQGSAQATSTGTAALVSLSLRPSATVYVCLIGDRGRKLIPGLELQAGESTRTYHARRFEINLGNNSVTMVVDGKALAVPPSSQAIGYAVTEAGGRSPLRVGQLPTCM
jgi:hypothetical protein